MNFDSKPTGTIAAENPETGKMERMAFWLPPGVSVADLGLGGRAFRPLAGKRASQHGLTTEGRGR